MGWEVDHIEDESNAGKERVLLGLGGDIWVRADKKQEVIEVE